MTAEGRALRLLRDSALGRLWQGLEDVLLRAWVGSAARRLSGVGAATAGRARVRRGAVTSITASLTALLLTRVALPVEPLTWVFPVVVLVGSVLILVACETARW
jgi:hypothetical protein